MDRMTMQQFVNRFKVRVTSTLTDHNPHMDSMPEGSAHWRVTLRVGRSRMSLHYSQGPAVVEEPKAADVLNCLAMDAASFENARSFEEWCSEYGYDTDSRKAEGIYKTVGRQAAALKRMLGEMAYGLLLWETESL